MLVYIHSAGWCMVHTTSNLYNTVLQLSLFYEQNNTQVVHVFLYCLDARNGSRKLSQNIYFNNRYGAVSQKTLIGKSLAIYNVVKSVYLTFNNPGNIWDSYGVDCLRYVKHEVGRDRSIGTAGLSGDRNPLRDEVFRNSPDHYRGPPSLLHNAYRIFPRGKAAGSWRWPPNPHLVPKLKEEYSYASTSPLGLRGLL